MVDARRRRFTAVCVWSLDRFGRSLAHVVTAITELHDRGISFISLREGLDFSTAVGRFQLAVMAALGEFERSRLIERTNAGLARARREGKTLGRPRRELTASEIEQTAALTVRDAARMLRTSPTAIIRGRRAFLKTPSTETDFRPEEYSEICATA